MPQQDLTVSLLQQPLHWQDPVANRQLFGGLIKTEAAGSDLIVLPEMFTAGFSMDTRKVAESPQGPTLEWMAAQAAASQAVITGSYAVNTGTGIVNRLVWMRPDGSHVHYDKRHLFRMAGEHERYSSGDKRIIVELNGWRCCPLICYDLRFPVWCRNRGDYDLLLFVANWPAARAHHWRALLRARAIENLSVVIGVNRVGVDGKGHQYQGDSIALDAEGQALVEPRAAVGVHSATCSAAALNAYRQRFPAHLDADSFSFD